MAVKQMRSLVKELLEEKFDQYNRPEFIENDPIAIPHLFNNQENIEIAAFFAATIAWGQRPMIIKKGRELMQLMEMTPFDFVLNSTEKDIEQLKKFVYRTFKYTDLAYFINALKPILKEYGTLGEFFKTQYHQTGNIYQLLNNFHCKFFARKKPGRTRKHLSNPAAGSAAKRMNMMLRWLVRQDSRGVDFGLWNFIDPAALYLPLDVHTARISRKIGLLHRRSNDWKAVTEITSVLQEFDMKDPVKYDFALFGLGAIENF